MFNLYKDSVARRSQLVTALSTGDMFGRVPLHYAAAMGNEELVKSMCGLAPETLERPTIVGCDES